MTKAFIYEAHHEGNVLPFKSNDNSLHCLVISRILSDQQLKEGYLVPGRELSIWQCIASGKSIILPIEITLFKLFLMYLLIYLLGTLSNSRFLYGLQKSP